MIGLDGGAPGNCQCQPPIWEPSRPTVNTWPTRLLVSGFASGKTTVEEQPRESGFSNSMICRTKRSPSRPVAATIPIRCGSVTRFTFSPIVMANLIYIRTIVIPGRSPGSPSTMFFLLKAIFGGAGKVIYEQAGWIYLYDPREDKSLRLKISVGADLLRPGPGMPREPSTFAMSDISPSGKRAVLEYRGEIVTVPAKKGDTRNLTQTPGDMNVRRPGRPTVNRSPIFRTRRVNTS